MKYERSRIFISDNPTRILIETTVLSLNKCDCTFFGYGNQAYLKFWLWISDSLIIIIRNLVYFYIHFFNFTHTNVPLIQLYSSF